MQDYIGAFVAVSFCCLKDSFVLRFGLLSNQDSLLKMYDLPLACMFLWKCFEFDP